MNSFSRNCCWSYSSAKA